VKVQAHLTDLASAANKGFSKRRAAMEEPGQPPEKVCELSVQDNGIGFDEKYTERIFAVFQRLNGRTEYEGTGVGLAVCRRITDRHGGTIIARSTPGNGSTFIVTLPLTQPKPKPSQ
jgi:signal transduction histidine kinase